MKKKLALFISGKLEFKIYLTEYLFKVKANKSRGLRLINKATYGRKVEDIYEYTLHSKQWMSLMIFHL